MSKIEIFCKNRAFCFQLFKSIRVEVFCKKGLPRILAVSESLFLIKLQAWGLQLFIHKAPLVTVHFIFTNFFIFDVRLSSEDGCVKFRKKINFRIVSKMLWGAKTKPERNSATGNCLENFWDFEKLFWMLSFKILSQQPHLFSKLAIKLLLSPQLMLLL